MVCTIARQGRELQRYNSHGGPQVFRSRPYRFKTCDEAVEILVISSQKGNAMMFLKVGFGGPLQSNEMWRGLISQKSRVLHLRVICRVDGNLMKLWIKQRPERLLKKLVSKDKRGVYCEGFMFALNVTGELKWVKVAEAREGSRDLWMREA